MTEREYVLLSNLTKVRQAYRILQDVLPHQYGGPTAAQYSQLMALLADISDAAEAKVKVT